MRSLLRGASSLLAVAAVAVSCTGCLFGSPATIETTANFKDVGNLVSGAPVQMAGITVGGVHSIALHGSTARVVLSVDKSADVPADVTAKVEQSTVLGEEIVQLVAPSGKTSTPGGTAHLLADGSTIHQTALVPGIEQFVSGGTAVLGAIGTSQLASLINAGGEGFGGQANEIKQLISNLNTVMAGYASRDGEIRTLVSAMGQLSSSLAPHATTDARALSNLERTVAILHQQSDNFVQLIRGLEALSLQGRSLLEQQLRAIDFQFTGLAGVTGTLNQQQAALATFLQELPKHDQVLHDVTVNRYSQLVDALIICGLPDGGSTSQAASSCHGAGSTGTGTGSGAPGTPTAPKVGAP